MKIIVLVLVIRVPQFCGARCSLSCTALKQLECTVNDHVSTILLRRLATPSLVFLANLDRPLHDGAVITYTHCYHSTTYTSR